MRCLKHNLLIIILIHTYYLITLCIYRNHLLDKGFNLPSAPGEPKTFLSKDTYKKLLKKAQEGGPESDMNVCDKLTERHLAVVQQGLSILLKLKPKYYAIN